MNKYCGECAYCEQTEYGYSSWTILGVTWDCRKNANPNFPIDDAVREMTKYANECDYYLYGDPVYNSID